MAASSEAKMEGRLLAEFSKVVYEGKEVRPEMQYGTIIVKNRKYHHYLYRVKNTDKGKPPIKTDSELTLTGPSASSIACPSGYLRIEVDLFFGTYKKDFRVEWLPSGPEDECCYKERTVEVKDHGKISIHFGMFYNAVEARIEVRLSPKPHSAVHVASVVAAHERKDGHDSKFSSLLYSNSNPNLLDSSKDASLERSEQVPLSRSIVAVPLGYQLLLEISLVCDGEELERKINFDAKDKYDTVVERLCEDKYDIDAKVIWNPIHETKADLNEFCYYSDESYEH